MVRDTLRATRACSDDWLHNRWGAQSTQVSDIAELLNHTPEQITQDLAERPPSMHTNERVGLGLVQCLTSSIAWTRQDTRSAQRSMMNETVFLAHMAIKIPTGRDVAKVGSCIHVHAVCTVMGMLVL